MPESSEGCLPRMHPWCVMYPGRCFGRCCSPHAGPLEQVQLLPRQHCCGSLRELSLAWRAGCFWAVPALPGDQGQDTGSPSTACDDPEFAAAIVASGDFGGRADGFTAPGQDEGRSRPRTRAPAPRREHRGLWSVRCLCTCTWVPVPAPVPTPSARTERIG